MRREERDHAIDRLRRIRSVQRREHQVPGVRRLQRGVERLHVADLADQDHVGRLPRTWRNAALNDSVSFPTSRWEMLARLSRCRNSIGSSIVMMLTRRFVLM